MSRFAFLALCVQAGLIQTALCGLACGCSQISYAPSGYIGGVEKVIENYSVSAPSCSVSAYEYSAPSVSYSAPSISYSAPSVSYSAPSVSYSAPSISAGASSISSGYGASYGGLGSGVVSAEGIIGASGETVVVGSVPVLGSVAFSGKVPAKGSVSIQGQCGCGCKHTGAEPLVSNLPSNATALRYGSAPDRSRSPDRPRSEATAMPDGAMGPALVTKYTRTMTRFSLLILCVMACLIQMALSQNCGCNQLAYSSGSYGGTGTGQVGVSGNIDACGNTCVVGSVPVLGSVDFGGCVPACGSVSISGQCGCGCN
ncbi:uncharacterized protein LOC134802653 [Cydia splendana]|uniref:uncharacterized protein LOC134802653 n=1 Tax=Cydia splendana TaxID=1100963 RepID=UPI00300CEAA3